MKVLVTGATGFIGSWVARSAQAHGHQVRALIRPDSDPSRIAGLGLEVAVGDLRDPPSLDRALSGCDVLFHVAGMYALWTPDPRALWEVNVRGTANVLSAARRAGVRKVVYTSSESTLHVPPGGIGNEARLADPNALPGPYKRTKHAAERVALDMCRDGLPVVIVNPTTPVGPGDVKPTPTGRVIVDFVDGRMPAYVNTGLNLIDVADVAEGHVLAMERGRIGERYVLGHENVELKELLVRLAVSSGRSAPHTRLPIWCAIVAAHASERIAARRGNGPPRIPLEGAKAARKRRYFDCSKAVTELGLPQSSVCCALYESVRWFRRHGYIHGGSYDDLHPWSELTARHAGAAKRPGISRAPRASRRGHPKSP